MAKLNRILLICIAVLAVAVAVLSVLLSQRRKEFRDRADKLALTVSSMVESLDKDSQTNAADAVNFKPADPESGTPESGTLGWKAYHDAKGEDGTYQEFSDRLGKAEKLAEDIVTQRNLLADQLAQVGVSLGMPEDQVDPAGLKNAADTEVYTNTAEGVSSWAAAVAKRDAAMIQAVVTASRSIGHPIDEQSLKERPAKTDADGNKTLGDFDNSAVAAFAKNVVDLNSRCTDYANALAGAVSTISKFSWETDPGALKDEARYSAALTRMANDFSQINERLGQLEQVKQQLAQKQVELDNKVQELQTIRDERDKFQDKAVNLALENKRLKDMLGITQGTTVTQGELDPNLEGKVLEVNPDWNYVVLNLGRKKVHENVQLLVARDGRFVAKLRVSKVLRNISIAEVLSEPRMVGDIRKSDRVILPRQQGSSGTQ
ncbi:MAG: hypothetical protein GXP31_03720 [Kiritimatiellaeota bacterium]|nr:hypothetical protein [Kiritimatiellota bacterium]